MWAALGGPASRDLGCLLGAMGHRSLHPRVSCSEDCGAFTSRWSAASENFTAPAAGLTSACGRCLQSPHPPGSWLLQTLASAAFAEPATGPWSTFFVAVAHLGVCWSVWPQARCFGSVGLPPPARQEDNSWQLV